MPRWFAPAAWLVLAGLGAGLACAQPPRRERDVLGRRGPAFHVDLASFPGQDENARVEAFVSIPLRGLAPEGNEHRLGRVAVLLIFYNSDGDQITGDEWYYHDIPLNRPPGTDQGRFLNRRYTFELPPGEFEVKARVTDLIGGSQNPKRLTLKVPDYSDRPLRVSDPVFGLRRESVAKAPEESYYGPVLPFPSRRYGDEVPGVAVYYEISDDLAEAGDYRVRYKLKSAYGQTRQDTSFVHPRTAGEVTGLLIEPRHRGLATGTYELEMEVSLGKRRVQRKNSFSMDETRITFQENPDKLRTIMGYVATNQEKVRLESLPDDSLAVFWEAFWGRRDPDPETATNAALARFLERVAYVTEEFGVLEPGWKSDRGRIYIKFGPPDHVEEFYTETYRYPTLVWYYYGRNRNYVFQDQEGFGRYRLVGMQEE